MKLLRIFIFLFVIIPTGIMADPTQIRVAILDNLQSQKLSSINYEDHYLEGVELAVFSAKEKGINLQYKYFKYGKEPLDIFTEIPKVKAWKPDFIIGPRSSDKFLLLKNYFNDVAVLSPLATAEEVYSVPGNFYSLSSSDGEISKAITQFIYKKFPDTRKIFVIAAIDCKSCYAIQKNIFSFYKSSRQKTKIVKEQFISTDVQTMDIAKMVAGFKSGDIIIIPDPASVSAILLARIVDYLKQPEINFIGADGWGSAKIYVGKIKPILPFNAYHLTQWSLSSKTKDVENFKKLYYEKFSAIPQGSISYTSYTAAMMGVNAYVSRHDNTKDVKEEILKSIKQMVKTNPNKYRARPYVFYKLENSGEQVVTSINPNITN